MKTKPKPPAVPLAASIERLDGPGPVEAGLPKPRTNRKRSVHSTLLWLLEFELADSRSVRAVNDNTTVAHTVYLSYAPRPHGQITFA